ncbi:MAG: hypothetical protein E6J27_07155 [Chloroflexi bacterium]|nr:MAG: hypothetical protein E6J27_07155 [Chloroflexota bacterium]
MRRSGAPPRRRVRARPRRAARARAWCRSGPAPCRRRHRRARRAARAGPTRLRDVRAPRSPVASRRAIRG